MHYYNLVVFLFSASVMATNTCISQYGFDVNNPGPGASCADTYVYMILIQLAMENLVTMLLKLITY